MQSMSNETVGTQAEMVSFSFPAGIYGFPEARHFAVHSIPGAPDIYRQMVCQEIPGVTITIVDPADIWPQYEPEITEQDLHLVGAESPGDVVVMAVVTIAPELKKSTANLRAPILFNPFKGIARQIILENKAYAVKQPIFANG